MACSITLADIDYNCTDLGIGGITRISLANRETLEAARNAATPTITLDEAARTVTLAGQISGAGDLSFNLKDGFSAFNEVKTINADGTSTTVPTITVEFPKMSAEHVTKLENVATPGAELVALIETAAGTYHLVGADYGLYASTVDMSSGAARGEKNRIQLTLTGEENGLAYSIADVADFETMIG
jgi:hypothetical protein